MKRTLGAGLLLLCFAQVGEPQEKKPPKYKLTATDIAAEFVKNRDQAKRKFFPGPVIKDWAQGATVHVSGTLDRITSSKVVAKTGPGKTEEWTEYQFVLKTATPFKVIVISKKAPGDLKSKDPQIVEATGEFHRLEPRSVSIFAETVRILPVKK